MTANPNPVPQRVSPLRPRTRRSWQLSRDAAWAWGGAGLLFLALLVAWLRQSFELVTVVPALAGGAALIVYGNWWPAHRMRTIALAVNVLLIFTYLWSLGETEHLVINVTPGRYTAQIGSSVVAMTPTTHGTSIGLYSGTIDDYRVLLAGETSFDPNASFLARFGEWVRQAGPQPAWTNVRIISGAGTRNVLSPAHPTVLTGGWSTNSRGEFELSPGSSVLLGHVRDPSYTLEADLHRGDGTQGVLLGVDTTRAGALFAPRIDQPDALWFDWSNGSKTASVAGTGLQLPLLPMVQRNVRLMLANAIVGLLLVLLALPVYGVIAWLTRREGSDSDIDRFADRYLGRRTLDGVSLVLAGGATLATALIATQLLEGIPHVQDSVADLFQAQTLASGHLWVPVPKLHQFFTEEFIPMYHGRWFGKYPPGWPLLLAIGVLLRTPWIVDPILTGFNIWIIYLIGREVYGPIIGTIAAALALSSPFLLFLGGSFMAHTATLFYLSAGAYLLIRWVKRNEVQPLPERTSRLMLLGAGFLAGMGAITRQLDALALALPFAVFVLPTFWRMRLKPALWLALGALPPLAAFLLYNWDLTGSPFTSPYTLWWPFDKAGFGPQIGMGGFTVAQGFANIAVNLQMLLAQLFGWPFYFTLALAAIPFLTGRTSRWDVLFLVSPFSLIAAYIAYWNPGIMYGPRYLYVTIPFFALLSARGLEELYRLPPRLVSWWRRDRFAALMFPAVIMCVLVGYDLRIYLPAQVPIYRGYNFSSRASLNAVDNAHIHHALVFVVDNPPGQWWSYGEVFPANGPQLNGDVVYAHDLGAADKRLARQYPNRATYRLNGTVLTRMSP